MRNGIKIPELNAKVKLYGSPSWIVLTISKDDLTNDLSKKEISKLTDDDMSRIAEKLGKSLMDAYWISLSVIVEDYKNGKKD